LEEYRTASIKINIQEEEIQEELQSLWKAGLGLKEVGLNEDFFELGGNSLKILPIIAKLKKKVAGVNIQDFFKYRTIADMTEHLLRTANSENYSLAVEFNVFPDSKKIEHSFSIMNEKKVIFLTGGTGFLGSHVLKEILTKTDCIVHCLVRPTKEEEVILKLKNNMDYYFSKSLFDNNKDRFVIVQGDLKEYELGLTVGNFKRLGSQIDAIIHCAADVRHYGLDADFERVNVSGTDTLIRLAQQSTKTHRISTISIAGSTLNDPEIFVLKENDFDRGQTHHSPYNRTKFAAEKLVREAGDNGLPITIYRVGNLVGNSNTGLFQRNIESDAYYRILSHLSYSKLPYKMTHSLMSHLLIIVVLL
jgi:nucleoside-diphosphate-sugar epimerase